jgi:hypothetical protein
MHMEIIRLSVSGMRQCDIADELGITPATVNCTLNSPISQARIAELRAARDKEAVDFSARLKEGAGRAIELLDSVMDGELSGTASIALRSKVATEILDRAGYGKVSRNVNLNLDGKLNQDDIEKLTDNALNIAESKGMIVPGTCEQVDNKSFEQGAETSHSNVEPTSKLGHTEDRRNEQVVPRNLNPNTAPCSRLENSYE